MAELDAPMCLVREIRCVRSGGMHGYLTDWGAPLHLAERVGDLCGDAVEPPKEVVLGGLGVENGKNGDTANGATSGVAEPGGEVIGAA